MKAGDKIYCIKDITSSIYGVSICTKGKCYMLDTATREVFSKRKNYSIVDDQGRIQILINLDNFVSLKELRKLKLENLNE